ncbi:transglycosylase, Slt family protein [Pseudooceanicola batsensis HTCC2597]|uniref:Transglycosylase, Slt family protein n=1 Tax=Pseudooceanicola batsensis (strain ATCC BAA-863 / DSM 15984 / KCTC 12145 / HTCC2597) TaxID=252305 RepID=A3TWJ4_PSEBH|nr:transglycosylase, Slt family protein [Pseudooceanicola batsensis HTCC2597]
MKPRRAGQALLLLLAFIVAVPVALPAAAQRTGESVVPRPLSSAFAAARDGNWETALPLAERDGPVARDILEWTRLRAGEGTPAEVLAFLRDNAHWPGLAYLRQRSEPAFLDATDAQVLAFFDGHLPETGRGALRLAAAQEMAGQAGEAQANVVLAWRTLALDAATHDMFLARYGDLLGPHHAARLSLSLWNDRSGDTERMLDLVGEDQARLARARLALSNDGNNVDALIEAVPESLRKDPGLAYDRYIWRIRKGLHGGAKDLLLEQSRIPGGLGYPDRWANHRRSYARGEMRSGDPARAYLLASGHQLTEGGNFADLEWLSGYIALTYLDDPEAALAHFDRLEAGVQTPISLGRAGYWRGRALEAMGDEEAAQEAYLRGGRHQTTFYGLLAAEKAGLGFDPAMAGRAEAAHWSETPLADSDLREAVMLFRAAGLDHEAERFLTHMAETATPEELASLGRMVEEAGDPHLEVMLGKAAAQRAIVLPRHYYALHPMTELDLPVSTEMALAIARRESEFDPAVTSHVGARGLMQLMPRTGLAMAEKVRDTGDVAGRLGYWAFNARLGSAYLAQLAEEFSGNVLLVSAGYNAGPSRSVRWSDQFGDPRSGEVDPVDWVEHIPFRETRNYVQRVAESLPIYRARLGREPLPIPFGTELTGSTIAAFPPQGE